MNVQDTVTFFLLLWIFAGLWMMGSALTPLGGWLDWTVLFWWMFLRKLKKLFCKKENE